MIAQIDPQTREARYFDVRSLTPREAYRLMGLGDCEIERLLSTRPRGEMDEDDPQMTLFSRDEMSEMVSDTTEEPVINPEEHYKLAGNSIVVDVLVAIYRQIFSGMWSYRHEREKPITAITLCSGYDSQYVALRRFTEEVGMDCRLVAWCEFDPTSTKPLVRQPAVLAHNLLFPEAKKLNLGNMTHVDWSRVVPAQIGRGELDLLTYSTPCTDISKAGKQLGVSKGSATRSSILWNTEQAIRSLEPKFLLQENVASLVGKKMLPHFEQWLSVVEGLGYRNYWAVLNAENYGVPQHRDRVFCVSVRNDIAAGEDYEFPEKEELCKTMDDIVEYTEDEQYFLPPPKCYCLSSQERREAACVRRDFP